MPERIDPPEVKVSATYDELVSPHRVHRSLYTDPAIFAAEMEYVFGANWTFVAHESEVPRPSDFVRKHLGLRPIIVTRGRDGQIRALLNRCTHRGATVCRSDRGNAPRFVCPYHNWTFNDSGALVGVPMGRAYGADFDKGALGLGQVRTESYRGFVFGTLDQQSPPLLEHLGPASALIDAWLDRLPGAATVVRHGAHKLQYRGNWKLAYDNSADGYHPGFSHASLLQMRKDRYGAGVDMQYVLGDVDSGLQYVQDLGNGNTFLDQRPEIEKYWPQAAPSPGREAYEAVLRTRLGDAAAEAALEAAVGSGQNLNIFPNLLIIGNQLQVIEPLGVAHTQLTWYATSLEGDDVPPEINSIRMRLQEDFPSFGEPDDLANFEECQAGLDIPEMEWVVTSRHLDSGREWVTDGGLQSGPVTDELPIRAFWQRWKQLMENRPKLSTVQGS